MRRVGRLLLALVAGALAFLGTAVPAGAATGTVTVFETEFTELTTYQDPTGCHLLPIGAHVLNNHTDGPVHIYADPMCLGPSLVVQPGHGSHVSPGSGSFSA